MEEEVVEEVVVVVVDLDSLTQVRTEVEDQPSSKVKILPRPTTLVAVT